MLLLQAFQSARRASNELISIACHGAMNLRPAPDSLADLMASDPAPHPRNSKYPHYITNSDWGHHTRRCIVIFTTSIIWLGEIIS